MFEQSQRYPDPRIVVLDERFLKYRITSSSVEQVATGFRWTEGPVWFGDHRCVLFSDIPNNKIMRYDETSGLTTVFRENANNSNGLARDPQGRLVCCEHLTRRVTRTEYDGSITVLAETFEGKRFNSPNDLTIGKDGTIWFSDPPFGINSNWEGRRATSEMGEAFYRIDIDGTITRVADDIPGPNGSALSPDGKILYIVASRHAPSRQIWAYDIVGRELKNKRVVIDAHGAGAIDGIAVDTDGNIWCGWGTDGRLDADPESYDGVVVFDPQGTRLAKIKLPERCANVCFGGVYKNRLYMAASHSVYALYTNAEGTI